jgi:translation initiation factor IF-3
LKEREKNTNNKPQNDQNNTPVNEQIRFPRVQLITHDGRNEGVISRSDALRMAHEAGLDLVLIADQGAEGFPVVKIMDFGKALYAKKKKQAEAKKHQKVIQVKEIKIRPKIGGHDFQTKIQQAIQFLKEGKRLKITLMFKGREITLQANKGQEIFDKIDKNFQDAGLANVQQEKDSRLGQLWSRIYYLKK